ncbi:MAG: hypothetical protein U0350_26935 [Caldilineaceae bacterium]
MLRFFREPAYQYYSPIFMGCIFTGTLYLGIGLLTIANGLSIPSWLWFIGFPILLSGFGLQLLSKRVLLIRGYQTVLCGLNTAVYTILLWALLAANRSKQEQGFATIVVLLIIMGSVVGVFLRNINRSILAKMPYGPIGLLNNKTGFVDPSRAPDSVQKQWDKAASQSRILARWHPIIAGLSMFLVKMLPRSEMGIVLIVIGLMFGIMCAGGLGGAAAYVVAIKRWEREHKKYMYVKFL